MDQPHVVEQNRPPVMMMPRRDFVRLAVIGVASGVLTYIVFLLFDRFIFGPILCAENTGRCASVSNYASSIAMIMGGVGALFAAVQQRIYRPLLVVLFVVVALWNLPVYFAVLPVWAAFIAMALSSIAAYIVFGWFALIRNFGIAAAVGVIVVIAARLVLLV